MGLPICELRAWENWLDNSTEHHAEMGKQGVLGFTLGEGRDTRSATRTSERLSGTCSQSDLTLGLNPAPGYGHGVPSRILRLHDSHPPGKVI